MVLIFLKNHFKTLILVFLFVLSGKSVFAQDIQTGDDSGNIQNQIEDDQKPDEDIVEKTMSLDIATSSYYELVNWARSLNIADTGTAAEIRSRLYSYYKIKPPLDEQKKGKRIKIESADRTEYLKIEEEENIVKFTGKVVLSISIDDSNESHRIEADNIIFNETTSSLSASGKVAYMYKKDETTQYFYGEKFSINLDTWDGIFLDSILERAQKNGDPNILMQADTILKGKDGWLAFDNATITTCDDDNPHYAIKASKVWIMGANEWAIANAVLSVGEVPMLYLPFFYYPGQEIVFHPVIGFREREGRFLQTTTYLAGEKPVKDDAISVFKLVSTGTENIKKLKGIFLQPSDEKKKAASSDFIKIMADLYSNLGGAIALKGKQSKTGAFESIEYYAGVGLSRSVFNIYDQVYIPFVEESGYESVWNASSIFGFPIPIRYAFDLTMQIPVQKLKISIKMSFLSDPFWNIDFLNRSEDMEWLRFLKQEEEDISPTKRSSLSQKLDIQYPIPTTNLAPWISTLELTKFTSSLLWNSKKKLPVPITSSELKLYNADPLREFFVPDQLMIGNINILAKGKLFDWKSDEKPASKTVSPATKNEDLIKGIDIDNLGINLLPPWEYPEKEKITDSNPGMMNQKNQKSDENDFIPPDLAPALASAEFPQSRFSVDWSVSAQSGYERRFLTSSWLEMKDIDWDLLYDLANYKVSCTISENLALMDKFLNLSTSVTFSSQEQGRPLISSDTQYVTTDMKNSWTLQDALASDRRATGSLKLNLAPFTNYWIWEKSFFSYSLNARLFSQSKDTSSGIPEWKNEYIEFDKNGIPLHSLIANISIQPWGLEQTLNLSSTLPPLDPSYGVKIALKAPFFLLNASTRYFQPGDSEPFTWDPFSVTAELGINTLFKFSNIFIYDIITLEPISDTFIFNWNGLTLTSLFRKSKDQELVLNSGWTTVDNSADLFRMTMLSASWKIDYKAPKLWEDRISFGLIADIRFSQNMLRFSESVLSLTTGITISIKDAIDISFSSTSRNSSVWRYFPDLFNLPYEIQPVNPLVDVARSFNFFDDGSDRRESLFKLRTISLKAVRHLHDWDITFEFSGTPLLETDGLSRKYIFDSSFSFFIAWRPIPEFSTKIINDNDYISVE